MSKKLIVMTPSESRTEFFRRRRILLEKKRELILREKPDPKPITTAVFVPTIGEQVQRFTSLSQVGLSYDDIPDDDFQDYLDDLPDRGLSPYENPSEINDQHWDVRSLPKSFVDKVKEKVKDKSPKKPTDKQSGPDQTPPIGKGQTAPQAKPEAN